MFQADLDIFWALAVFEGSNSKINNYEAVYWQNTLKILKAANTHKFHYFCSKTFLLHKTLYSKCTAFCFYVFVFKIEAIC